jgi:hypothetical protein
MSTYTEKRVDYYGEDSDTGFIVNSKKADKIRKDPSKHYPNKNEAQELRKIMASTGLSEEEVRQDAKYRKVLADAQKQGQKAKRTETQKTFQKLIKEACKQTGLVPQHPETIKALQEILDTRALSYFKRSFFEKNKLNAEIIIKQCTKK